MILLIQKKVIKKVASKATNLLNHLSLDPCLTCYLPRRNNFEIFTTHNLVDQCRYHKYFSLINRSNRQTFFSMEQFVNEFDFSLKDFEEIVEEYPKIKDIDFWNVEEFCPSKSDSNESDFIQFSRLNPLFFSKIKNKF
eukprot:TRINITY_DN6978_c0_g1_i1.p1 TRINITY_DN6978_c0_g1~~TRINITY_DN6978_c0_g1_i1.p1  ORF type:complete len:138 (-),score=33.33 TRINITY_DN6978_c0_g1_i1:184-597(-)